MSYVCTRFLFAVLLTGLPAGFAAWIGVSSLRRGELLSRSIISPALGLGGCFLLIACLSQPNPTQALSTVSQMTPQILGIMLGASAGSVTGAFSAEKESEEGLMAGLGSLVGSSVACMVFLNQAMDRVLPF